MAIAEQKLSSEHDRPTLAIRPAAAEDAPAVRAFLESLSEDSRWLRYHTGVPIVRSWMVDAVVASDHDSHEALLAWHDGRIVGIAEWGRVSTEDRSADVGIVVSDDCRRHGVARALLRRLVRSGRACGLESFTAHVLSTNRPMIALMQQEAPLRTVTFEGPTVAVHIPISA
jgi:ribosomal protein S18 acetylase RimI-like enzyme